MENRRINRAGFLTAASAFACPEDSTAAVSARNSRRYFLAFSAACTENNQSERFKAVLAKSPASAMLCSRMQGNT